MNKIFLLFIFSAIWLTCPTSNGQVIRTNDATKSFKAVTKITGAQIAASTSVTVLAAPQRTQTLVPTEIVLKLRKGSQAFSGSGTDSTLIYSVVNGARVNQIKIEDSFFTDAYNHQWTIPLSGPVSETSALIFKAATQLTGGTGSILTIIVIYKIDEN